METVSTQPGGVGKQCGSFKLFSDHQTFSSRPQTLNPEPRGLCKHEDLSDVLVSIAVLRNGFVAAEWVDEGLKGNYKRDQGTLIRRGWSAEVTVGR